MLIKSWSDIGITQKDFQRLWDLPAGEFKRRMEFLKKAKRKETFFPQQQFRVRYIKEQILVVDGESEVDVRLKVLGASNPFENVPEQTRTIFERIR